MRLVRVSCIAALLFTLVASSHLGASQDHVRNALVESAGAQVLRGAELYDRNCAVCHGDSGLGFAEAKLAFPEDHRACTRCHKPGNPAVMSLAQVHAMGLDHDLFSLGAPPALRGEGALMGLSTAGALFRYTRATMPRYRPGSMADEAYLDITAFLLYLNGGLGGEDRPEVLTPDDIDPTP